MLRREHVLVELGLEDEQPQPDAAAITTMAITIAVAHFEDFGSSTGCVARP